MSSQFRAFVDATVMFLAVGGPDDGIVLQNDLDRLSVYVGGLMVHGVQASNCQVVRVTTSRKSINTVYK